jgi:hypothetical protein
MAVQNCTITPLFTATGKGRFGQKGCLDGGTSAEDGSLEAKSPAA